MITVTNEMRCGKAEYITGNVKIEGEFKINTDNKVERIDCGSINNTNGNCIGSFNAYKDGAELKVNLNDLSAEVAGTVATGINTIVAELEEKYNA